jgi:hypothetical protein
MEVKVLLSVLVIAEAIHNSIEGFHGVIQGFVFCGHCGQDSGELAEGVSNNIFFPF